MITALLVSFLSLLGWTLDPVVGWAAMCIGAGMVIGVTFGVLTLIRLGWTRPAKAAPRSKAAAHRVGRGRPRTLTRRRVGTAPLMPIEPATSVIPAVRIDPAWSAVRQPVRTGR